MNLLYFWAEDSSFMSQWQRMHIIDELENNGHKVIVFNPLNYDNYEHANEEFLGFVKRSKYKIDLFMTCLNSKQIFSETLLEFKKLGIPSLLICFDNLHAPYLHKSIASLFDLVWLTSFETKALFDRWGANTIFSPYAANPRTFYPDYSKEINSIGFIGRPYGTRTDKLNLLGLNEVKCNIYSDYITLTSEKNFSKNIKNIDLLSSFVNLTKFPIGRKVLYGAFLKKFIVKDSYLIINEFVSVSPSVSFSQMNNLYSNHSLSLGISELKNTYTLKEPVHKLHLRTFEIPMCGGLQITSYTEELSNYFEDENEIVMYKSEEELISKAKFFLNPSNEKLRIRMKKNARERAINEHTWTKRFEKIFMSLQIKI